MLEGEFDARDLRNAIHELLADPDGLKAMSDAMLSLAVPDAVDKITEIITELTS